mgnify:CR=1 FL=1
MKKLLNYIVIIAFALVVSMSVSITAFASAVSIDDMKVLLISKGLPDSYLSNLTDEHIESLYEDSFIYNIEYEESIAKMNEYSDQDSSDSQIVPYGHIDESMFELKTSKTTFTNSNGSVEKVNIVVNYRWIKEPMNTKTDGISVNWDASVFTFLAGSFYSYDELLLDGEYLAKINECTVPDLSQQGGIGYSARIGMYTGTMSSGWARGTASFYVIPTNNPIYEKSTSTGASAMTFNVNYVHDRTPLFGSISFSVAGFGVSVNAPVFNDSLSSSINFYYTR